MLVACESLCLPGTGYGDVTIHNGGKVFMTFYVLLGILLVADAINNFFDGVYLGPIVWKCLRKWTSK